MFDEYAVQPGNDDALRGLRQFKCGKIILDIFVIFGVVVVGVNLYTRLSLAPRHGLVWDLAYAFLMGLGLAISLMALVRVMLYRSLLRQFVLRDQILRLDRDVFTLTKRHTQDGQVVRVIDADRFVYQLARNRELEGL